MTRTLYYGSLLRNDEFKARLKARWPVFKAAMADMPAYYNALVERLSPSAERDYDYWSGYETLKISRTYKSFAEESSNILDCFQYNIQWIEDHLDTL